MSLRTLLLLGGTTLMLAGCMHHNTYGNSGGDVAIDSLSASRTALLRVQNNYSGDVRIYTVLGGQANYIAKATAGQVRTWVMDPQLFPASAISFEVRPADGAEKRVFGPYKLNRGEIVDLVLPMSLSGATATVHHSTR